jgi:glutamate/tyrosine decarboxylase-like PLP-dependent enzyme
MGGVLAADMAKVDYAALLTRVAEASAQYLEGIGDRPVNARDGVGDVRERLGGALPGAGEDPADVVERLIALAPAATMASAGPRYFGFVVGGALPAALAAEMLTVALDQNAAMAVMSPLAAVTEEIAAGWLVDLLGLPASASVGFVTGGQAANTTCLAVARHHVLAAHGWDVETRGLSGAPPVHTVVGAHRHATIDAALRPIGLGAPTAVVEADGEGRMRPEALEAVLRALTGPVIVCAQAGNVNSGAFDPFPEIAALARAHGAWLHIDGAFGLWAQASPSRRHLTNGVAAADSWAVDGHKWLNVPYDCGYAITAHPDSHRETYASTAGYYIRGGVEQPRDGMDWVPEASRRARGIATWAALRSLGRNGVAELVERCCGHAARFAELVAAKPGVAVLNEVVLNQVVVRFGDSDDHTRAVLAAVQQDGTCWAGGSTWHGQAVMRWSVSNWSTTADDIARSAEAVLAAHRRLWPHS